MQEQRKKSFLFIILFVVSLSLFSQTKVQLVDSISIYRNLSALHNNFLDNLLSNRIDKFINITIGKEWLKDYYTGFITIHDDNLVYTRYWIENDSIYTKTDTITNKEIIDYVKFYFYEYRKYVKDKRCGHFNPRKYYLSGFSTGTLTKDGLKYNVNFAKNEWDITSYELDKNYNNENDIMPKKNGNGEYLFWLYEPYQTIGTFKIRLFKFRCLGLFKNLKSRKMFNKLMKYLKVYDK